MKSDLNSLQSACKHTLEGTAYEEYCDPVSQTAEKISTWTQEATTPIFNRAQSTWTKTGKHFGAPGQLLMAVLVAGVAYNLMSGKKQKKPQPLEERVNRLPPLNKTRRLPFRQRRR